MLGFLRRPLGDLCISRPVERLSWGIPLPFDPGYVCYVWFDALINYLTSAGFPLEHCVFDETSYTNPDHNAQYLGRGILGSRDAIVLIPRAPLTPGAQYTVSITVDGTPHSWSFWVIENVER